MKLAQSGVASNVALATQAADSDFIFANCIQTNAPIEFFCNFKVRTTCPPVVIADNNARELRFYVRAASKNVDFSVLSRTCIPPKMPGKNGRKIIHHESVHVG